MKYDNLEHSSFTSKKERAHNIEALTKETFEKFYLKKPPKFLNRWIIVLTIYYSILNKSLHKLK